MIDVCITDAEYPDTTVEEQVFTQAGLSFERYYCRTPEDVIEAGRGARALLVQYAPISSAVFDGLPGVGIVSRYGTGFDNVDVHSATDHGVWVSNVPVYGTDEVAIHTLTLMLAALRGLSYYEAARRSGSWPPPAELGEQPRDLSVGVLGAGRIGKRVIELCLPIFGRVVWTDPYTTADVPGAERVDDLPSLLEASNILTVHLPLDVSTTHLIGYDELRALREPRMLVNASRGAIVSSIGLERALEDQTLWAAGLDVLESEPGPDAPILLSDRVLLTPHAAWASRPALIDVRRHAAENIAEFFTNGRPSTPVNEPRKIS